jgi:hypothetical protein
MARPHLSGLAFALVLAAGCDTGFTGETPQDQLNEGGNVGSFADPCGAGQWQSLVGQDSGVLNVSNLPTDTRILYPDMTVTGQFVDDRMNVTVDGSNTITRVYCG